MAPYRLLQANVNHSSMPQDLLLQDMAEWGVDLAVVAEPHRVPDYWIGDDRGLVAIAGKRSRAVLPLTLVDKGRGWVALWGEATVVGVYASPALGLPEFEDLLGEVEGVFRRPPTRPVLVMGDFNAKSPLWGSPVTSSKGEHLEGWAEGLGLLVLNRGTGPTCRHGPSEGRVLCGCLFGFAGHCSAGDGLEDSGGALHLGPRIHIVRGG